MEVKISQKVLTIYLKRSIKLYRKSVCFVRVHYKLQSANQMKMYLDLIKNFAQNALLKINIRLPLSS